MAISMSSDLILFVFLCSCERRGRKTDDFNDDDMIVFLSSQLCKKYYKKPCVFLYAGFCFGVH